MTLAREREMLTDLREMASLDKSDIAEKYRVPIDSADIYFKTKTMAVLDTIIDGLTEEMNYQDQQKHYKGQTTDPLAKV